MDADRERIVWSGALPEAGTAPAWLAAQTGLSRSAIKRAMLCGSVWVRRKGRRVRLRRASAELPAGAHLWLYYDARLLSRSPPQATLLQAGKDFSVWFKPAGLMTQGNDWGDHCSLLRQAEQRLRRPIRPVHRLDRETAGLLIVAHGRRSAAWLSRQFRQRRVEKRYRAWAFGAMTDRQGVLDYPLDGREALTRYRALEVRQRPCTMTLVDVTLDTGRLHQIRRHFAMIGHAVVGDPRYGSGREKSCRANGAPLPMQLVAYRLGLAVEEGRAPSVFELPPSYWEKSGFLTV